MPQKIISLSSKEELKVFMSPQRQQLLRVMRINGKPMTAKMLADKLGISASAVTHHISKLKQLGVVEEDHTETINGIAAKFLRLTDVTVRIGAQINDGLFDERNVIIQNILHDTLDGLYRGAEWARNVGISEDSMKDYGDVLSGALHLKPEDACELMEIIRNYIKEHETYSEGTQPWEYALILYNSGFMR